VLIRHTQGDFAVGLQGTDKVAVLLLFDEAQVFRRGEPHIEEHKPKGEEVGDGLFDQLPTYLILGHWTASFLLLRLGVHILLGLGHQVEAHRQTHSVASIERRQKVDPFEQPIFGVVVVPTHKIVLVGVRLLLDRVVNEQYPRLRLHLAGKRFDRPPQIGRRLLLACQVSGHLIVADFPLQQLAQSRGGGGIERGQQVIGIQICYRLLLHTGDSTPLSPLSRKVR
jgi:hypothetical protein